ncbi:MAG: hypothetical protein VKK97_03325 [Synechococcaceae cyanobacterium]|nr:hypothetical protein [Synechococcaceae cyanobacterium]
MGALTLASLWLSVQLNRLLGPLRRRLSLLHRDPEHPHLETRLNVEDVQAEDAVLVAIQERYINLFQHVDHVDAAAFSAGEIETLRLRFLRRSVTAADAQRWLQQAPGLLISLGLLGTFLGLCVGLGQISGVLATSNSGDAIRALKDILAPMGTAFQTSLGGLSCSLFVLIVSQLNGSREGLESCEALLASWLETVLPQQLGNKLNTPLRQSIEALNASLSELPHAVYAAVERGMQNAFADKLDALFDTSANLATEAQTAIRQLAVIANALQQSGEDFLSAGQAFQDTNFAVSLRQSAEHLQASGEQLCHSSETLSKRLLDVRDNLLSTQAEWGLLAQAASQELQASRALAEQVRHAISPLQSASTALLSGTETLSEASNQLRKARLEVGRDRRLAIDVAQSLRNRLRADAGLSDSCQSIADNVERSLSNWDRHQIDLSGLERKIASLLETLTAQQQLNQALWNESQAPQASVNDNNLDSVVCWDDSDVRPVVAPKPTVGFSNATATVLAKDHQASPSDDSPPTVSSANSDQHDDSCSSVSIVAEYQQALDRGERSLPASLFLAELNITDDAEDAIIWSLNVPTQLKTVPGGGSYLLVGGKDHRYWLVPSLRTLFGFKGKRPNTRIFSYEAQAIHSPELRQPAEVKPVGDLWEVVTMGVIAVPA